MNTQIPPATYSQKRLGQPSGSQRVRSPSYAMKKNSNVFANTSSIARELNSSKATTPTSR